MKMRSKARFSRDGNGFTILEVMIALAIFASAVTFFTMAYLNTLTAIARVQVNQSFEQDMATIRQQVLLLSDSEDVEMGGEVVTGQHGVAHWNVEYEPTSVADLFRVVLRVRLNPEDEEAPREATETFYLTRPSWSDPLEREELRSRTRERLVQKQTNTAR